MLLDRLEIRNGLAQVREPAWGLTHADFRFQVTGTGSGRQPAPGAGCDMPAISLGQGGDRFQGDLALSANLTDRQVEVKQGQVRLGAQRLAFNGGLHFRERSLSLAASGHLDLAQAQRLASPGNPSTASGLVDFQGKVDGTLDSPAWSGTVQATQLRAKGLLLHPGSLTAAAQGTPSEIRLERLTWASLDGRLQASGNWSARSGYLLQADASAIPLAPVAGYTRAGFLKDLTASFSGVAKLPAGLPDAPWAPSSLESLSFHGTGQFIQDGQRVGGMGVDLERGRFTTPMLDLDLAELEFHGKASGTVGRHGLASVEAEASAATDAADVAGMLMAWDIGMTDDAGKRTALDMSGAARIEAQAGWSAQGGMQLKGRVELQAPRWHGAKGDRLGAGVTIDRDVLRVSDIELDKGDGRAYGELWLTWADLPRGADAIDMWYSGFGLPVREGLKAADLGDLELDGTGNGWVRLHGPFERMLMEGQAEAAEAAVYGLRIPAASADFFMDIDGDLLRVTDLRAADSMAHLGDARQVPDGPLALQGSMEMDTRHETWKVAMRGDVDSRILGLPGPAFQARVDARLDGPLVAPLGPIQMPQGSVSFTQGRLTQGGQQLDGLEGSAAFTGGNLKLSLGLAGKPTRVVTLDARQQGRDRMSGDLELDFGPESADTAKLAAGLTQDFLKDTRFRFHAQGDWTPKGLRWQGQLDPFRGRFEGFSLVQSRPGTFTGDLAGMDVDLAFEGRTSPRPPGPTVPVAATGINLHGRLPFSPGGPLALQLSGSSNLANLKTILDRVLQPGQYSLLADLRTEGSAQFNLNLGGTLAETTLDGTLTLQGGRAVVHGFPLSVEHLDFTAQFKGRDIIIPRSAPLRGTLAQGALTAWGQMTWHLGGVSAYDLHASVEDFQLRDLPDGFDLQGSVDANLKGSDQDGGLLERQHLGQADLVHHRDQPVRPDPGQRPGRLAPLRRGPFRPLGPHQPGPGGAPGRTLGAGHQPAQAAGARPGTVLHPRNPHQARAQGADGTAARRAPHQPVPGGRHRDRAGHRGFPRSRRLQPQFRRPGPDRHPALPGDPGDQRRPGRPPGPALLHPLPAPGRNLRHPHRPGGGDPGGRRPGLLQPDPGDHRPGRHQHRPAHLPGPGQFPGAVAQDPGPGPGERGAARRHRHPGNLRHPGQVRQPLRLPHAAGVHPGQGG